MPHADAVRVRFVDAGTGQEIGRTELPADQLPESFEAETTVQLGDASWFVVRAEPPTAAQFRLSGRLTLTLRRLEAIPARDIRYSLPTICDLLPEVAGTANSRDYLELHEDDWRQVELVSVHLREVVEAELSAIWNVHDRHAHRGDDGRVLGYQEIHVRSQLTDPLATPGSRPRLTDLFQEFGDVRGGVGFRGQAGVVPGSFTVILGPPLLYGVAREEAVAVLGVHPALALYCGPDDRIAGLQRFMRAFELLLVDWCQCSAIDAGSVHDYLSAWWKSPSQ